MTKKTQDFIKILRNAMPYINKFRGKTFLISLDGSLINEKNFESIALDINLLISLGIKIVLVFGVKPQLDQELKSRKIKSVFVNNIRLTDQKIIAVYKKIIGELQIEISTMLSSCLPKSSNGSNKINISSGNFITAKPVGVVKGKDLLFSGEVRKIDTNSIISKIKFDDLVLIPPIGHSPSGEIFNIEYKKLSTEIALNLNADKLIFLSDKDLIKLNCSYFIKELSLTEAKKILQVQKKNLTDDTLNSIKLATLACENGVKRTHFVNQKEEGALLYELFSHEGIGILITSENLEKLRQAKIDDITSIIRLIKPYEENNTINKRSRDLLEREIKNFYIYEHDQLIIGCVAIYNFKDNIAELACLVVDKEYQSLGIGTKLLDLVENIAKNINIKNIFALTTKASHWFKEKGFIETSITKLPYEKNLMYNLKRKSRIFMKKIDNQ